MNAVGIDASKGKSMVTILRPFGEIVSSPHEVRHTTDQIDDLVREIRSLEGESRIVMEYTGRYHEPMARWLSDAGLFVSLVNPKLIISQLSSSSCEIQGWTGSSESEN